MPTLLISTWEDGVFVVDGGELRHELIGRPTRGLAAGDGRVLAILDEHSLCERTRDGAWQEIARSESPLSTCLITRGEVFVGTDDDAHLLRLSAGTLSRVDGFDRTPGRETWEPGGALIDGKWMGPPLGIRSMTAAPDGGVLLANVHVGGIPRSTDRGATWHPTIEIGADVHEVAFHPSRPEIVAAAAAIGLCVSRDGGATWRTETEGLDHSHCSAVAFVGDDILVSASDGPFAEQGAVYRRPVDGAGPLKPVSGGLPRWTDRRVDTANIGVRGPNAAIADGGGNVYLSEDAGVRWERVAHGIAAPSAVVFL
ncbi:MAG TPA: hypothetical protein VGD37_25520 [Kofleriaceae bacterium]|jgi:hypothetical protein